MNKKSVLSKANKSLCLIILSLIISGVVALSGCTKEKAAGPKATGPAGTCEVLDRLPRDLTKPVEVNFDNKINVLGVTVNKVSQEKLSISYYLRPMDALKSYDTVFVHFTDKNNKVIFQNDHPFCQQKSFEELKGKIVKETLNVDFPKNASGQEIFVKLGLYDPKSRGRLKIASANGIPTDDDNTRAIIESLKL